MLKQINIYVILRILIGVLFVVSGFEKAISHYQNFLYVIQSYEIFPVFLQTPLAYVLPWIELLIGLFLIFGLWTQLALRGALVLFLGFVLLVSQAILRKLPIDECGCFGQLISLPLHMVLLMDSVLLFIVCLLILRYQKTISLSLDRFFS